MDVDSKLNDKMAKTKTYDVMVHGEVIAGVRASRIIKLCNERKLGSDAECKRCGFLRAMLGLKDSYYRPLDTFPEFAPYVSTTLEEEEINPRPDAVCYLSSNGNQTGPFAPAQIRSMWAAGTITSDSLFFHEDLGEWRPVRKFCENEEWNFSPTSESRLLKQVVNEQQKATSQLGAIRWVLVCVFIIPFLLYKCSHD